MTVLSPELRSELERAVVEGREAAEAGVRAAVGSLGVFEDRKPGHLDEQQAALRRGLRAKERQLGGADELVWDGAYEQWHRLLFARFLAERELLIHPEFGAAVTLAECEQLAPELGELDGWGVAGRFAQAVVPGIFRLDDPCVRLRLAPEHRLRLQQIVTGLPTEVFTSDDGLGWVYQYWQSKRKDEVNASERKIGGSDLGPVTQLFTENYMVRFLLENSLGAWWAARHPQSSLQDGWEFLRFDEETGEPAAGAFEEWPDKVAEVTVMDPCCGSGHFLVEAFKMLWRMRVDEEGLDPVAAQDAVLSENLFGLELDPRCVQIAAFAVALQAWKDGGGWRRLPELNIACSGIPARAPLEEWTALADGNTTLEAALERLHGLFKEADTLGSLIDPRRAAELAEQSGQLGLGALDFDRVAPLLEQAVARETEDSAASVLGADAAGLARAAGLLSRCYVLVATNVPFVSANAMTSLLDEAVRRREPTGKGNLGTALMSRWGCWNGRGHESLALVCFSSWLSTKSYAALRRDLAADGALHALVRTRSSAFRTPMYDFGVALLVAASASRNDRRTFVFVDLEDATGAEGTRYGLLRDPHELLVQSESFVGPDSNFVAEPLVDASPLGERARATVGLHVGDDARFRRQFWEVSHESPWERFAGSPSGDSLTSGLDSVLYWPAEGQMHIDNPKARVQGTEAWGRRGVTVRLTGTLPAARFDGEMFSQTVCAMWPKEEGDLLPLLCFLRSDDFHDRVRAFDTSLKTTIGTMLKVPFELERWRVVAEKRFPEGLPEPWSDDPTQWLFEGDPAVATEPLQVGVGRLVGFRWPEQPDDDGLDGHADDDGIVCLPAVAGELSAADRLRALLANAFGEDWGAGTVRRLIDESGSSRSDLPSWLAKDFFKQHCQVFSQRPFVWHITDGLSGGFSALVNYHQLDRAGLEKLSYAYLGDWIEQQTSAAGQDVAGADSRLAAAQELQTKLELIAEGGPPYDIYVRWKKLHEQPVGWDPDLDDGVRLNIRPFVKAGVLAGPKSVPRVHWKKDRGKNPDGSLRPNDLHHTLAEKRQARAEAGS